MFIPQLNIWNSKPRLKILISSCIYRTKTNLTINWIQPASKLLVRTLTCNSFNFDIPIVLEIQGWHYYFKWHLLFLNPQYARSALKTKHWRNVWNWIRHKNFEFVTGVDFGYFALKSGIFSRTPFRTRLIWTIPDKFEQFQTSLDKSGQV